MGDAKRSGLRDLGVRQRFRRKVQQCLEVLERMLAEDGFARSEKSIGLELELNLVDHKMRPAMNNDLVLSTLNDSLFTTEVSQHNIELNVAPRPLAGNNFLDLEKDLNHNLRNASTAASESGTLVAMIGMIPTLTTADFDIKWLSNDARYTQLNDQIFHLRGEDTVLSIEGRPLGDGHQEKLKRQNQTILPEAAGTSLQLHLQVTPEEFANHWNAAQCLAGPQVAIAGNSPFLLNKALWHETRIPLFLQATDTRSEELRNQGVRPRVWFGERWINSPLELFEENSRYFPGLLTDLDGEDPVESWDAGKAPVLNELCLHNSTIWRWNRPVYDVMDGVAHLRIENRVLPAGPTVLDMMANAAFFYGAQRGLVEADRPLWTEMSFSAAEENLYAGARDGFDAQLYWPKIGWLKPDELVLRILLPLAHEGLRRAEVSDEARERYLGVIEKRCLTRRTGSSWQRENVTRAKELGLDRETALTTMLANYLELVDTGEPVHAWPLAA